MSKLPQTVIADAIMELARSLAGDNPGKSVTVTVCGSVYHTPPASPDKPLWAVQIGHGETMTASTFDDCMAKIAAIGSPETKKAKAAELRRQADALEAEIATP